MKNLLKVVLTVLVATVASVGLAPSAHAYPEAVCNLEVEAQVVESGVDVDATCTLTTVDSAARAAAEPETNWVMTFNGETRTGTGPSFSASFPAPQVTQRTELTLTVVGTRGDLTCQRSATITVIPAGGQVSPPGDDDGLPGTGGPRLALLFAGLGLVLAGGAAIRQSRKGHDVPVA